MSSIVSVVFDGNREYELIAQAGGSREEASRWLDEQWQALECEPANPMGKVLLLDKILCVAKYAGEDRFAAGGEWAKRYANAVATLLERPVVRIDVAARVVG
ncbi:MAG: hypothetical protein N3C63_05960 [Rhodocyclaceae bacterium]|nr:hypothetical protein [Rhodocyclaceae bacterium]